MIIPIYQVDAFTEKTFSGNPAAVCLLKSWLPDATLQNIAEENNLSETAFLVKENSGYRLRWFTPSAEVDLCGHATLASAHVIFNHLGNHDDMLGFSTRSGVLTVKRNGSMLVMNFPSDTIEPVAITDKLCSGLNIRPMAAYKGKSDYLLVFQNEEEITALNPDFSEIIKLPSRGIIATAKGIDCDFVSRFFAPAVGINEDPVTGSAHTTLVPFWSKTLHKKELFACQRSKRGGQLYCKDLDGRIEIAGLAKTYLVGTITLDG